MENAAANRCEAMRGAEAADAGFKDAESDDFTNDSGFGARGPVLTPETYDTTADEIDEAKDYRCVSGEPAEGDEGPEVAGFEEFMKRFYSKEPVRDDSTAIQEQ